MDIRHEENGEAGAFASGEGADRAELTYSPGAPGTVIFEHTYVPPSLRGKGAAAELLAAGVAMARERGLKIVPACSYVRVEFDRSPERYADLRAD